MTRLIDADALYKMLSLEADDYMNLGRFECARGLESALWAIKDAPTVNNWISVKDKLPEEHDSFFCATPTSEQIYVGKGVG